MLLNLYFSGIPRCVVKGVVSNPLFQIFLDPALEWHDDETSSKLQALLDSQGEQLHKNC